MSVTTMKMRFHGLERLWILGILLALPVTALAASTNLIYVSNNAGDTISVIDAATNKVVQTIEDMELTEAVVGSPDGSRIYINKGSENALVVLDRKTGKVIKKVPLSGYPNDIAITKDGKRVLVCIAENPGALDVIDTTSLEKVKSIPLKAQLHDITLTQDGKYAVVGSHEQFASTIDLATEQVVWTIDFDKGVAPLVTTAGPDGSTSRLIVELNGLNGFAVVDFAKHQELQRIKLPDEPGGFPKGNYSHGLGVSPDQKTLWVASTPGNAVFVYSLPDLKLMGHVSLPNFELPGHPIRGGEPNWFAFTPDSRTIYVSSPRLNLVSAIDMKAMKIVAKIPVGELPKRMNTVALR
jgi:YVTN family beta-propeller protein